jgi:hypothetical protein
VSGVWALKPEIEKANAIRNEIRNFAFILK